MCNGKVINEKGESVLEFDIYAFSVARKEALKIVNKLLRKHEDGTVKIKYPQGEIVTIKIKSKR